jgi:hypothetical protein
MPAFSGPSLAEKKLKGFMRSAGILAGVPKDEGAVRLSRQFRKWGEITS